MSGTAVTIPRCWADGASMTNLDRPIECQALGTDCLGLCPRHAAEILGDIIRPPLPTS